MSRKGMLWKTGWNRRTGYGQGEFLDAYFVNLNPDAASENRYETALAAPFAFQSVPFWIGMLWVSGEDDATGEVAQPVGDTTSILLTHATTDTQLQAIASSNIFDVESAQYVPVVQNNCAVVSLVVVQQVGPDITVDVWMDGALRKNFFIVDTFAAPPNPAVIQAFSTATGVAYAPNFAAGNGVPSEAQIATWFATVRNTARIASIPGITTDVFDAESLLPGPVPNPIPNTGGGQNFDLVNVSGATPSLDLVPISFNY